MTDICKLEIDDELTEVEVTFFPRYEGMSAHPIYISITQVLDPRTGFVLDDLTAIDLEKLSSQLSHHLHEPQD